MKGMKVIRSWGHAMLDPSCNGLNWWNNSWLFDSWKNWTITLHLECHLTFTAEKRETIHWYNIKNIKHVKEIYETCVCNEQLQREECKKKYMSKVKIKSCIWTFTCQNKFCKRGKHSESYLYLKDRTPDWCFQGLDHCTNLGMSSCLSSLDLAVNHLVC